MGYYRKGVDLNSGFYVTIWGIDNVIVSQCKDLHSALCVTSKDGGKLNAHFHINSWDSCT